MTTPLYNSLSPHGQSRFGWTLGATLGGVSLAYTVFGLIPYLYFAGVIGEEKMASSITLDLPRVWWAFLIQAAYCLALAFSYPFMLAPAIAICEKPLIPRFLAPVANETHRLRRNIFRALIVACTLIVSLAGSEMLNNFVSLIGAFCCAPLAFVYPCLFHIILVRPTGFFNRAADVAMIVFGTAVFGFSTWQAIAGWASSPVQPCLH
jgi:solute carrier family 36 (proton-coupled amino acid transporter)